MSPERTRPRRRQAARLPSGGEDLDPARQPRWPLAIPDAINQLEHLHRATGITAYLSNGGTLEHAQQIPGHASPKTTKLYDRTADTVTVDEIERIVI